VVLGLDVDMPTNLISNKPCWRNIDMAMLDVDLGTLKDKAAGDLWPAARGIVDGLPRSGFGKKAAGYWGPELYTMRKDLRPLRLALVGGKADVENYNLVRFVYRCAISNRRFDHIKECLAKAADPEIFLLCRQLESRRVLPGMDDGLGGHVHRHEDISDLIAR